jgi:hypothetical protein
MYSRELAWSGHPKDCQKVNRPPDYQFLADRIDRGKWNFNGKEDLKGKLLYEENTHRVRLQEKWTLTSCDQATQMIIGGS